MNLTPRISVIVPSYNHRQFLPMRMDSILRQTRQDFELILLDDASPDGSGDFLETFLDRPNVRVIRNAQNTGSPFAQWNRGIKEAKGELIWIAESDDVADPQLLETLTEILDQHPSVGLAFCRSQRIDETGVILPEDTTVDRIEPWQNDFRMKGRDAIHGSLYVSNVIVSASAVVFRRKLYEQAGPASTNLRLAGDWLQWCKILMESDLAYVSRTLSGSRIHSNTRRQGTTSSGTLELESLAVQRFVRSRMTIEPTQIRQGARRVSTSWLQTMRAGRFSGSLIRHPMFLWRLFRTDPRIAASFMMNWPYAFLAWCLKRFLLRKSSAFL
jgi:glycosyltransferase involved in cell wall biosynthesis